MRLRRVWLGDYKNLRDVTVNVVGNRSTILLGQNGTGKSNFVEALVQAFAELHRGRMPKFDIELEYECHDALVQLDFRPSEGKRPRLRVDGESITQKDFRQRRDELLPKNVFAYYSGPSNRLVQHFEEHQRRFYDELIDDRAGDAGLPLRPLFYAQPVHSQFVLLANDESVSPAIAALVRERLGIDAVESVLFVLRRPEWSKAGRAAQRAKTDAYWGATGEVRRLIDYIHQIAFLPAATVANARPQFNKPRRKQERRLLYLPGSDSLRELLHEYPSSRDFFKALESLYISDMLEEVRIRVRRTDGQTMTFTELSEGEQQLLTVLGLVAFTREDESLFLLDEPDTHINPQWAQDYVERADSVLGESTGTHVLMATHDPLIVGELEREDILLFEQEPETRHVTISTPTESPKGLGVAGILTGQFFDLDTTLDADTQDLLEERYELELKFRRQGSLADAERQRMRELSHTLAGLGFAMTVRDPLFSEYLRARADLLEDPAMDRDKLGRALAREAIDNAVDDLQ
jgi:ABC-type Mn2+/Zn2+ transport system ATPase subunit